MTGATSSQMDFYNSIKKIALQGRVTYKGALSYKSDRLFWSGLSQYSARCFLILIYGYNAGD